jgi:uncharacterized protein
MRKLIYCLLVMGALAASCGKSSSGPGNNNAGASFDRKSMLTNLSTNIIVPAYTAFQSATSTLNTAVTTFNATPNADNLTALQSAFKAAYLQWQSTSVFELGPAEQISFRVNTNTYPTDVNQINANINSNTYNKDVLANLAAKGLPALDYLLFGVGADNNAILTAYTTDALANNRKTYLAAISAELNTNATTVLNAWKTSYSTPFVNADGTDQGSSTGVLVNQLVYDYEILKNDEIGIPAGIESMGNTFPSKVQAYYSKMSVQLTLAHLQAIQNIYQGKDGLGLDDYLTKVNAQYNGSSLADAIQAQFIAANTKLQALSDPLSDNITNNNAAVTTAYTELQKLTVLLKTDMTSSLGILITFGDNDGD